MREPTWKRLGLDVDEWRECRLAAIEMTAASGAHISPTSVAVEYALARDFDDAMPVSHSPAGHSAPPRRRAMARP